MQAGFFRNNNYEQMGIFTWASKESIPLAAVAAEPILISVCVGSIGLTSGALSLVTVSADVGVRISLAPFSTTAGRLVYNRTRDYFFLCIVSS